MELSRQMLLLTAVNYGSYYLHITKNKQIYFSLFFYIDILFRNKTTILNIDVLFKDSQ